MHSPRRHDSQSEPSTTPRQNAGGKGAWRRRPTRSRCCLQRHPGRTPGERSRLAGDQRPLCRPFNDTPAERRGKGVNANLSNGEYNAFNDTPAERRGKGSAGQPRSMGQWSPSTTPRQNAGGKAGCCRPRYQSTDSFNDTPAERRGKGSRWRDKAQLPCPSTTPRQNAGGKILSLNDTPEVRAPSTTPRQNAGGKARDVARKR